MKTILLIGACGSGKTWVMLEFIKLLSNIKQGKLNLFRFVIDEQKKIVVLGVYDNTIFQGSDRLSMAVMKDCDHMKKFQDLNDLFIICEGDRFTNKTFIDKFNPVIIKILDDGSKGRKKRNSNQTDRQIKAIQSRVNNIKENYLVNNSTEALELLKKLVINE